MGCQTHSVMFRGANNLTLDSKGRMVVPTKYRDVLEERCGGKLVVTVDRAACLLIFPLPDWLEVERRIMALPNTHPMNREVQRQVVGNATDVELDGQGRVLLPSNLRERAQLTRDAVLVGQGPRFELWDAERWNERGSAWQAGSGNPADMPPELAALTI